MEPAPWTGRFGERFVAMAAVPGTDWMVFRVAAAESLLGGASRSTARTIIIDVAVGMVGALAIFYITARFLRPMSVLRRRALRVVDPAQAPDANWPEADGEIGELTRVLRHVSVQLAESRSDIEHSLQTMQAVLAHAPVGIGITKNSHFDLVSSQLESMLGYAAGELEGAAWDALVLPGAWTQDRRDAVEAAFRDGIPFQAEIPLQRRDGSTLWTHVHGATIQQQRIIWIVSDATAARYERESLVWSATHDPLTELVNRREFERQLNLLVSDRRSNACALFVDLDYFKLVNDGAGHAAGDVLLKRIAHALQKQVRTGDTVGRVGGDEFAVLLRGCGLQQALQLAENARAQVELYGICEADPSLRVTASIGVVEINATHRSLTDVLEAADQACYEAKHAGRNAVRHAAIEPIEAQPSL
jgi:diguanylate cyclase (GGDEF)-like protein/PAS domain S-box-containing protein